MAVLTKLNQLELEQFSQQYAVGQLHDFHGIGQGLENSNYFVNYTYDDGQIQHFVLTILEELDQQQLQFHLHLLDILAAQHIPVPSILQGMDGTRVYSLYNKPAILSQRLEGEHVVAPTLQQCAAMGNMLADLHLLAANLAENFAGTRSNDWLEQSAYQASAYLTESEKIDVETTLRQYLSIEQQELPHGIIHGDLFRDNVLFQGDKISGVLDFYSAGVGFLLFDIAVVVNDWCRTDDNRIDEQRYAALLDAYIVKRPWTENESLCWSLMLQVTAMRFWLSRLLHVKQSDADGFFLRKDPEEFRALFYFYRNETMPKA